MKGMKGIKIKEHRRKFEIYRLKDILNLIENGDQYFWTIYDLEVTLLPNSSVQSFKTYQVILDSSSDYQISWDELNVFASNVFQVINGYFLGCREKII